MLQLGSLVRVKSLILDDETVGEVIGMMVEDALMALAMKMSYHEAIELNDAFVRYSEQFPDDLPHMALVVFDVDVTTKRGKIGRAFWFPTADLQTVKVSKARIVPENDVVPLTEEEYNELEDSVLEIK